MTYIFKVCQLASVPYCYKHSCGKTADFQCKYLIAYTIGDGAYNVTLCFLFITSAFIKLFTVKQMPF